MRKNNIELNNKLNLQTYLNELYHETDRLINQIQFEIDKIINSTSLNGIGIAEKADYAKAINSLITSKSNALKIKLDINKLATEVLKFSGDENGALNALNKNRSINNQAINIKDLQSKLIQKENESETITYKINR